MKTLSLAGFETKTLVTHSCFLLCVLQWWAALHLQETCKVESDMLQVLTISNKKCTYWIWWKRLCFFQHCYIHIVCSRGCQQNFRPNSSSSAEVGGVREEGLYQLLLIKEIIFGGFGPTNTVLVLFTFWIPPTTRLNLIYPHGVKESKSLCQLNSELMWRLRALQFCRQWKY